jgi:hypothetical protein
VHKKEIDNNIIDNYILAQICLCSILVKWIKTKGEVILNEKEIKGVFQTIISFINREYGEAFINIMSLLEVFKKDDYEIDKMTPVDAMKYSSNIVLNIHPKEFNITINSFYINNYEKIKKYCLEFNTLNPSQKKLFPSIFQNTLNKLLIIKRMDKYKEITRLNFFQEFKGEHYYLPIINEILLSLRKDKLIDLDDIFIDRELIKERIDLLFRQQQEQKEINKTLLKELNENIQKCDEVLQKYNNEVMSLTSNLNKKKKELEQCQERQDSLMNE